MADNAMSAIGVGKSLQAQPKYFEGLIGRKLSLDEAELKYKAAREKQSKDDWTKYIDGVKIEQVHPLDYEQAQKDVAQKFIAPAAELVKKYGASWSNTPEAAKLKNEAKFAMEEYAVRKAKLDSDEKIIQDAMKSGTATPEMVKAYEGYRRGDNKTVLSIQDPYGTFGATADPSGRVLPIVNVVPKFDWTAIADKEFNKPSFQLQQAYIQDRALKTGDKETQRYIATYGIPRTKADAAIMAQKMGYPAPLTSSESLMEGYANDPMHFKSLEQYVRDRIDSNPEYAAKYHSMSQPEKSTEVAKLALEKSAPFMGVKLTAEKFSDQPDQTEKNKQWQHSGNTIQNDKNVWHYDKKEDGSEIFTMSKTNPAENAPFKFIGLDGKEVTGVPTRMEINPNINNGVPKVYITKKYHKELSDSKGGVHMVDAEKEVPISYEKNASKIENEFGFNPYQIRGIISGSVDPNKAKPTGSTKGKTDTVKSTSKSEGKTTASEETFVVEGTTYKIPKDKVAAFKKAKGL